MHSIARLALAGYIDNIQASWYAQLAKICILLTCANYTFPHHRRSAHLTISQLLGGRSFIRQMGEGRHFLKHIQFAYDHEAIIARCEDHHSESLRRARQMVCTLGHKSSKALEFYRVKMGPERAVSLMKAGCNDMGQSHKLLSLTAQRFQDEDPDF